MATAALEVKDFEHGEIDSTCLKHVLADIGALLGKWEPLSERSESHEEIMAALGVPYLKRAVMKNSRPVTEITEGITSDGKKFLKLTTALPFGNRKEAQILLDGSPFDVDDGDTGMWTSRAFFRDGVLYQRRENKKTGGVMYDTRCVLNQDPCHKVSNAPLMLFKWGFVDKKGKTIVCHRWMKKLC